VYRLLSMATVLCIAVATPLVGQQTSTSSPAPEGVAAAPASSAPTTLPGPRLQPEWRSVQPAFADSSSALAAPVSGGSHTITVTTVVLVLVIIIAILLLVK
jgi:hypothetical protein